MNRQHLIVALLLAGVAVAPSQLCAQQVAEKTPQPAAYLSEASSTLDSLPKKVPHDAKDALANLRKHLAELEQRYQAQGDVIGPPLTRTANAEAPTWRDSFAAAERDLVALIGAGSSYSEVTPTTAQSHSISMPAPPPGASTTGPARAGAPATAGPPTAAAPTQPLTPAAVGTTGTGPGAVGTTPPPGTAIGGNPPGTVSSGGVTSTPAAPTTSTTAPATTAPSTVGTAPGAAAAAPAPTPATSRPVVTAPQTTAGSSMLTMATALAASKVSLAGLRDLDPNVRAALERVRLQLELFYTSTM